MAESETQPIPGRTRAGRATVVAHFDATDSSPHLRDAGDVAPWLNGLSGIPRPDRSHRASGAGLVPAIWRDVPDAEGWMLVDYTERLRRLAISDARFLDDGVDRVGGDPGELDAKTLGLVRLAALIAVGGAGPSYGAQADAAVDAGATAVGIVDVLVGVIPIVGWPCVVAAAPKLALAIGYDLDEATDNRYIPCSEGDHSQSDQEADHG